MKKILMVVGCILGVIGGAAPHTNLVGPIPLNWLLAGVGAVILLAASRMTGATGGHGSESSSASGTMTDAGAALQRTSSSVRAVYERAAGLPIHDLAKEIDGVISRDLMPVMSAQSELIARQGFAKYAAHTGPWAAGERMLYRAWSAATDGHRPEAVSSLREAITHFEEASREWAKA